MTYPQRGPEGAAAPQQTQLPPKVRYCLYARKSTEQDEKQALSIDSQVKEMLAVAERDGLEVMHIRRESHSAKDSGQRPVFNEIIGDIRRGEFNAILTWAPDRLSRNAGDLGVLVDLMDQKRLVEIRTYGQCFTNNPNEKFLLMILGSQAKLENDNKSVNVKRGLRTRVEMGLWPSTAPTGYLNEKRTDRKGYVLVDSQRAPVIKQMFEKVAHEGWSGRRLFYWLKDEAKFTTKNSKELCLSNVHTILKNAFYYGMIEYPRGSGNCYQGRHEPIITKELYDATQQQLSLGSHLRRARKEFAFTKLMRCGVCGSGITAEEKFKKLKGGGMNRYIYYGCTRYVDKFCKNLYTREEELIKQLVAIIDNISLDEIGVRHKLELELKRFTKFQKNVLGVAEDTQRNLEVDIKNYAKYLLREGNMMEKRELLASLKSKVVLTNGVVTLQS